MPRVQVKGRKLHSYQLILLPPRLLHPGAEHVRASPVQGDDLHPHRLLRQRGTPHRDHQALCDALPGVPGHAHSDPMRATSQVDFPGPGEARQNVRIAEIE